LVNEDGGAARSEKPDICVILNTRSGKKRRTAQEQLEQLFEKHPGRFTLKVLSSGREIEAASRDAIRKGYPVIVAAGGDGTISGISGFVAEAGRTLGILPFGTFNYFARALEMPLDIEGAIDVLAAGHTSRISLGDVNGATFLNNASLGAYAAILQRREKVYRKWGRSRLAAYWSVLTTLLLIRTTRRMVITVDGEEHRMRTPLAFVASNVYQLEGFGLPGADCVRDGKLALFVAPDQSGLGLLAFALRLAFRDMQEGRDFTLLCGREIVIETKRNRELVARDGEKSLMSGPFRFRLHQNGLRVVVPQDAPDPE
jgi:diacylglycerol kinase family enzyme